MKDYYSILGLNSACTQDEIKSAYKKLATKLHPDKNNGEKLFDDLFKNINEAYSILSNEEKRKQYDDKIKAYSSDNVKQQSNTKQKQQTSTPNYSSDTDINRTIVSLKEIAEAIKIAGNNINIDNKKIEGLLSGLLSNPLINSLIRTNDIYQNRVVINCVLDIFNVLSIDQKERLIPKLIKIAGTDNEIIEKIYSHVQKKKKKTNKLFKDILSFIAIIIGICLTAAFLKSTIENNSTSDSTESFQPSKIEATSNSLLEGELTGNIESAYKGNQLKTGDSPYNHFFGKGFYNKNFKNRLEIKNGQLHDAIVCLKEYDSPYRVIRNEYVRAGENFTMSNIPNGRFYIKTFFGKDWNPEKVLADGKIKGAFDTDFYFSKSENVDDLIEMVQTDVEFTIMTVTLYVVNDGNMQSQSINADEFFN